MNASTKIEINPFGESPEYRATEIYRGIEIQVIYCYLANPTSKQVPEETLGWRFSLPDASYWMYKFAAPEEAFLKARETVDLRLQQGTLTAISEPEPTRPNLSEAANLPVESEPASVAIPHPAPEPAIETPGKTAKPAQWNLRAILDLFFAGIGTFFTASQFYTAHPSANWLWGATIMLIQTPIVWAGVYGNLSALLWLCRCITLNRSKKPLWNLRAGWAVLLGLAVFVSLIIYSYNCANTPVEATQAIGRAIERVLGQVLWGAIFFFYGALTGITYLLRSRSRTLWTFAGLIPLLIIAAVIGVFQSPYKLPQPQINNPPTSQAFDEHLSLTMPVAFSPVTDFPLEQLPPEARERTQKATQRSAFFNGVSITVMQLTPVSGVALSGEQYYGIQSGLNGAFWGYYPEQKPPKIDWGPHNDLYQSGTINFTITIGGKPNQVTVVAIAPKSAEGFWVIMAYGSGEAATLADKTARAFVFK